MQAVRTAALLHDIGNMAVPEHILSKPDALTPEEFERVKIHPRVGAEILENVPFGAPVSDLVLCHHERWDGLGYPAGLRGKDIPLGARVLAIADCFSTLQADRPYRPARSEAEAIAVLREYRRLIVRSRARRPADRAAGRHGDAASRGGDRQSRLERAQESIALQDIAGAHREEQTLYEIAQALGCSLGVSDAMALIQEKVSRLVPFVTCALFLGDDDRRLRLPLRARPGHRSALQVGAEVVERNLAAPARVRRRPRRARRGTDVAAAVPAALRRPPDRRAGHLSLGCQLLHR